MENNEQGRKKFEDLKQKMKEDNIRVAIGMWIWREKELFKEFIEIRNKVKKDTSIIINE